MNYLKFFFLFLFPIFTFGQQEVNQSHYEVEYKTIVNDTTDIESYHYAMNFKLYSDGKESYYKLVSYIDTTLYDSQRNPISFEAKTLNYISMYKSIENQSAIYGTAVEFKKSALVTDFPKFEYKKGAKKKKILGHDCSQLFLQFRGRNYEIYYANDLKINDGPFKFMNAPGLILEVMDFGQSVHIIATQIEKVNQKLLIPEIPNRWKNRMKLTYKEFILRKDKWRTDLKAKVSAEDPNSSVDIPYRNIEILIPAHIE
ncbi:GLPGLI family protein [uncultured Nonlabens sp.]|uniref:GLPGLI family protein n=1 Tax=uncultured Nonlabens sp. TaxID=859306 RepID=UPI0026376675|nr:GLPGLI family protein [uncultured Nonlabens sp.]